MGSSGGNEVTMSMRDEANCPETTIEIKIKTLDSQTYTLQVDKCLPIPALKEQIASVTGVLSEQQRLICRGKVLKDDQLLSAYHVEDGHTLHMVVRQSIPPLSEVSPDHAAAEQEMNNGHQGGPSVVVGTLNISEQGGLLPDLSRIVSAVLGSLGIANVGSVNEGADIRVAGPDRVSRTLDGGSRNASGQQTDQAPSMGQSTNHYGAIPSLAAVPLDQVEPPVIPDSLTTLSQYLTRLRDEFSANDYTVRGRSYDIQSTDTLASGGQQPDAARPRLLSPEALAEVMVSARQLLVNQAADCLSRLTQQLEDHVNVVDSASRSNIQRNVERSGVLLQNLGAALLELGRTATTLRMGPRPVDADVSSNPAVFISTSAPNPIMVQQLPFQSGSSFGVIPVGTPQSGSGISGGSLGSGFLPRNIDIRIRTGPLNSSPALNQRDPATVPQPPVVNNSPASGDGQTGAGGPVNSSSRRVPEVLRVVPIRTVVAALPASVRRIPSDSSRGSVGLFYPVLARAQSVGSVNLSNQRDNQASNETVEHWNAQFPDFASGGAAQGQGIPEPNASTPSADGAHISQGFQSGLDQLLRSIFPGEQFHINDVNIQGIDSSSGVVYAEPAWGAAFAEPGPRVNPRETTQANVNAQEATPRVSAEGLFLSNLLQQIMPAISENLASGSGQASQEGASDISDRAAEASTAQDQENSNRGTASRERDDSDMSSSKRQKRE